MRKQLGKTECEMEYFRFQPLYGMYIIPLTFILYITYGTGQAWKMIHLGVIWHGMSHLF